MVIEKLICLLDLVYHPFSNQEADWLGQDAEFRRFVKRSKIYMLAQRQRVLFSNLKTPNPRDYLKDGGLAIDLQCGPVKIEGVTLPLGQLVQHIDSADLEVGPHLVRVINNATGEVEYWCTPDKLLFDHWHGRLSVSGLERYRELTQFRLLYVGISKEKDSLQRLLETHHEARMSILTNEYQIDPTARVSDELMFLLFDLDTITMRRFEQADFSQFATPGPEKISCIADAEKALIKLLDPEYNSTKYKNYPRGKDGLFDMGLDSYVYVVNENIVLKGPAACLQGLHLPRASVAEFPDVIRVAGDTVHVLRPAQ